jgi:hypothetical protein
LSWSLLEAMSAGCLVIGSDTAPVREVLSDENGILVPFFDVDQLSGRVIDALAHRRRFRNLRKAARRTLFKSISGLDPLDNLDRPAAHNLQQGVKVERPPRCFSSCRIFEHPLS